MNITIIQKKHDQVETDVLILGYFKGDATPGGCFPELDKGLDGALTTLVQEEQISSKFKSTQRVHTFGKLHAKQLLFVGLGERDQFNLDKLREAVGKVTKEVLSAKVKNISYCFESLLGSGMLPAETIAHAIAEATVLSTYQFNDYKTSEKEAPVLEQVTVLAQEGGDQLVQHIETGRAFGEGTCIARTLVNMPGNLLTPTILAEKAEEIAKKHGLEFSVLDRKEMEELGMGALLAVARGSDEPPKMIVIKYQGQEKWDNVLSFVGKGLTFDTGGISLKPSAKMDEMKMDMGGSAAVLGAMDIIGALKPACNVLAVIPSTENMPSGSALKPGDVITSLSGKTIEVKNTDAEGRLILADGITYAKQLGANYIVDLATLTGAVLIALGDCTTGAITNNENLMMNVYEASMETGEPIWRLPNSEPYKQMVKSSNVADLNNAPGRLAGTITAGLFLGEFAEDTPWVHLDIAGTAWSDRNTELSSKGGTGVMVRTLATIATNHFPK